MFLNNKMYKDLDEDRNFLSERADLFIGTI